MTTRIAAFLLFALVAHVQAQAPLAWPEGKRAAIVLTYDDALASQLEFTVPQLRQAGFKGTFFLAGSLGEAELARWKKVHRAGHEIGNHSRFHPCPRSMLPAAEHHTEDYDVPAILAEIRGMNEVLEGIDGRKLRPYSVPCSQMLIGGGVDYTQALRESGLVNYVRTGGDPWNSVVTDFRGLDRFAVPSWGPVDGPDGRQLIAYVARVSEAQGLGVLQFHGVGGDYLSVSAEAHRQLLAYLKSHPEIWVAPFTEVMDYVALHSR